MKKYIIASIISIFPVFILGLCLPIATIIDSKSGIFNETFFWICAIILSIGISILLSTMLMLVRYTNVIDRIDEVEYAVYQKEQKLNRLISKYNKMILEYNETTK